jgi:hypothetical protein
MNIGVIVDNDLISDIRVNREIRILKESGHNLFILCFGFKGKNYPLSNDGIKIERILFQKSLRTHCSFL